MANPTRIRLFGVLRIRCSIRFGRQPTRPSTDRPNPVKFHINCETFLHRFSAYYCWIYYLPLQHILRGFFYYPASRIYHVVYVTNFHFSNFHYERVKHR